MTSQPPYEPFGQPSFNPPPGRKQGMPVWGKALIGIAIGGVVLFGCICGGLIWLGATSPPMEVLAGNKLPADYVDRINELALLDAGERIELFYTDGFRSFEERCFLLTDKRVIIYQRDTPKTSVWYGDIVEIDARYSGSMFEDSTISVFRQDGSGEVLFAPGDSGGDRRMVRFLQGKAPDAESKETGP